ncbi:MAG TPA: 3,4-dihydroxyphenylacetate 2,3-dioxygenase [Quisquiliibacterium sp.]|nr:3,4-dihydroxyphenylacetate 2,3-dioxygenase [Quisquiliibacterium sp.]HPA88611.1 3,4-dihydroxyphenylacetate 2,3-dioxygenase [Quisquiliibacterium sp.]HQD84372.1 3,4-dihydroxyphenylacetate 2,3-dioxygenase [Quisquiliibacterium sp.]HQN11876.1 3,4-dihydroxyphenylacetate 2,3-dioxygenase [Quisquiliibacterium sp.]HQP66011.1 3,4-dihydroxyphenylacetate 2,3-dioxygenase [Quisquiliibacterium sp.]
MGTLALAAKITHVPSMYLSEQPGPHFGCRDAAIAGHRELGRRCRARGVDTIVVLDVHWLVNAGYHVNCAPHFAGTYTSNELPHFIRNLPYAYPGNPALGQAIARAATDAGVATRAHHDTSLGLEYGTLVPMRYMNADGHFRVVSVAAWCNWHALDDSRRFGAALRTAIERGHDGTVAVFASGSLSHRFNDNGSPESAMHEISDEFYRQVDLRVVELWRAGDWPTFTRMLPRYAERCVGEGGMHDTAMLLGMLGWDRYDRGVDVITPYFASSGTGQINCEFPVE